LGGIVQKRLIRKLDLEVFLSQIDPHPSPKASFEQYTIPADVAATMLHMAAYNYQDIVGKTILDLGCGTGRLAIGAAWLGAHQAVGIDIDKTAVGVASQNSMKAGLKDRLQWITADVEVVRGEFDTVVQNPPFGVQKRGADRKFLQKALEVGKVIYSLHKNSGKVSLLNERPKVSRGSIVPVSPSPFIQDYVEKHGGAVKAVYALPMSIPRMFDFHTKRKYQFAVDLYIITKQ
jgi:putative methylase